MNIKDRTDIVRDESTNAILYKETESTRRKSKMIQMEQQINIMKDDLQDIKKLLERIINGR